jgi:hypothetical protein
MKALIISLTSLFAGIAMIFTGNQSLIEAHIEHETNNEFVVEFNENVDINSEAVANVENVANATVKDRIYETFYVFTVEDGSYEKLQVICASVEALPEVKTANTKWMKR